MNEVRSAPSMPMERIKIRVLCDVPVFAECRPIVGKVYDAIQGYGMTTCGKKPSKRRFCVILVNGKSIVLRNGAPNSSQPQEYEEI